MKAIIIGLVIATLLIAGGFFFLNTEKDAGVQQQDITPITPITSNTSNENIDESSSSGSTAQTSSDSSVHEITIKNFGFQPSELRIRAGDSVSWTNQDSSPHTITSISEGILNSGTISKGQSYSHKFNEEGTYDYFCSFHSGMRGKIIVE